MSNALVRPEQIEQQLSEIMTVEEAKEMADQAEAFRRYAKRARKGLKVQNHCAYVKFLAERRAGELLREMVARGEREGRGGDRKSNSSEPSLTTLADLGISYDQSSRWQRLAHLSAERLEGMWKDCTVRGEELTFGRLVAAYRDELREAVPWDHGDPLFWGRSEAGKAYGLLVNRLNLFLREGSKEDDALAIIVNDRQWVHPAEIDHLVEASIELFHRAQCAIMALRERRRITPTVDKLMDEDTRRALKQGPNLLDLIRDAEKRPP